MHTPDTDCFRISPRTGWAVVWSQAVANAGFFAVIPFLAGHLDSSLGVSATLVGVVLGVRTASQQGMFVLGGVCADRWGPRTLGVVGCAVRVAGFGLLGYATTLPTVILAAILTGLGGALFSPSLEATLSHVSDDSLIRREWFARFAAVGEAGALIGPIIGAAVSGYSFRTVCVMSAGFFVVLGIAMAVHLPHHLHRNSRLPSLRPALTHRRFMAFAAIYSVQLFAWNQLYFAFALEAQATASLLSPAVLIGAMFALTSILVALSQVPVSRLLRHLPPHCVIPAGFALIAVSMLAVPAARLVGLPPELGVVAGALILATGHMIAAPTALASVGAFAGTSPVGAFHGILASFGGLAVLLGNTVAGPLLEPDSAGVPTVSWVAIAAVVAVAAVAIRFPLAAPHRAAPRTPSSPTHPASLERNPA